MSQVLFPPHLDTWQRFLFSDRSRCGVLGACGMHSGVRMVRHRVWKPRAKICGH
uniref:Uncharacterized protein n=1 Tax=Anguilla anguilla TaxID=7936 RepID=A0A0E9Q2J1_ANGAN